MKKQWLGSLVMAMGLTMASSAHALVAELADPSWNGDLVPTGMQCQKFGGVEPRSPALVISEIPEGTNVLIFEYSDRSYAPMDNGGHGKVGYAINQLTGTVWVPPVSGHTFELPSGFFMIEAHRNPKWDQAGAYMPPCSGGKKNSYYVTVKAAKVDGQAMTIQAQTVLELGKY
jgi:hypothetical protein